MTALFELPSSSCSPRVKYAVVANMRTKPITLIESAELKLAPRGCSFTENGDDLADLDTTHRWAEWKKHCIWSARKTHRLVLDVDRTKF